MDYKITFKSCECGTTNIEPVIINRVDHCHIEDGVLILEGNGYNQLALFREWERVELVEDASVAATNPTAIAEGWVLKVEAYKELEATKERFRKLLFDWDAGAIPTRDMMHTLAAELGD